MELKKRGGPIIFGPDCGIKEKNGPENQRPIVHRTQWKLL